MPRFHLSDVHSSSPATGRKPQHRATASEFRTLPGIHYVWIGASCDYAHPQRPSAGVCRFVHDADEPSTWSCNALHSTEFRMLLTLMLHALLSLPSGSTIVFVTNVSYCQNYDRPPTDTTANADLISQCIEAKQRHASVAVKMVPYHKFPLLPMLHAEANAIMRSLR